ncbi:hypothetical protein JDV02_007644 [Purpureocillium takamizusanense]|uniref:Uncharacterized protein n=1 Tax=Purpureocillium takamizusanense TaxID=2060973 RepID=A0A9Q8QKL1_9HYPO|nr:uncharacterized protein JDV02_007644 [Purpureocillium takamizusanense]UNI21673.1 hypothetical protein JDV02_007644 [Purpureocillium takamizusanense]
MARRLPWKTKKGDEGNENELPKNIPKAESPAPSGTKTPVRLARHVVATTPRREHAPSSASRRDPVRSPSTSPPPAPPQEQFMIPGPDADDRYRMVEDELLAVAQRFTTHLHRAEYNRLKAAARAQGEAAVREMERPVVAPPLTATARFRREASRRGARQRRLQQRSGAEGNGSGSAAAAVDLPWVGTSLQGLMERPRSETRTISSYASTHSTTRAAAGYHASSTTANADAGSDHARDDSSGRAKRKRDFASRAETTSTTSSLTAAEASNDATAHRLAITPRHRTTAAAASTSGPYHRSAGRTPSRGSMAPDAAQGVPTGSSDRERHHVVDLDEDEDDPFGVNKRRVRREKSREQMRRAAEKDSPKIKLSPDTIPSFL